jgi:hypothetical protein
MARLVECERRRRAGTSGDHTRRTVRALDRDRLWARAAWPHRQKGHAVSASTRAVCTGVQGRDRVPFAATGATGRDIYLACADRALARLSRDVPAAFTHCPGASDVARLKVAADTGKKRCRFANLPDRRLGSFGQRLTRKKMNACI